MNKQTGHFPGLWFKNLPVSEKLVPKGISTTTLLPFRHSLPSFRPFCLITPWQVHTSQKRLESAPSLDDMMPGSPAKTLRSARSAPSLCQRHWMPSPYSQSSHLTAWWKPHWFCHGPPDIFILCPSLKRGVYSKPFRQQLPELKTRLFGEVILLLVIIKSLFFFFVFRIIYLHKILDISLIFLSPHKQFSWFRSLF